MTTVDTMTKLIMRFEAEKNKTWYGGVNYFRTQIVDDKEHRNLKMTWNIVIKINKPLR